MNNFKNAEFHKWAEQNGISDEELSQALVQRELIKIEVKNG